MAAAPKPVRKEIAPNVILYTTRHEQPTMFLYQLEVTKLKKIVFEIDFQGSENFQCVLPQTPTPPAPPYGCSQLLVAPPMPAHWAPARLQFVPPCCAPWWPRGCTMSLVRVPTCVRYDPCVSRARACRLDGGGLKQETVVNPFEKKTVAKLTLRNPKGAWGLRCRYKWLEGEPDKAVLEAAVHKDMSTIARLVMAAQRLDFGADSARLRELQTKCEVRVTAGAGGGGLLLGRRRCVVWRCRWAAAATNALCLPGPSVQKADVNFVDVEFPPSHASLLDVGGDGGGKVEEDGGAASDAKASVELVTWRRPVDFFDGEYDIFMHKVEPQDIQQGGLGDCWCVAVCTCVRASVRACVCTCHTCTAPPHATRAPHRTPAGSCARWRPSRSALRRCCSCS